MSSPDKQNAKVPLDKAAPRETDALREREPREKDAPREKDLPAEKDVPVEKDDPTGNGEPGDKDVEQACDPKRWNFISDLPPINFPPDTDLPYTPFLVIRSTVGDNGTRPLPPGTEHWNSCDVGVESSLGIDQPIPGEDNTVFARVSNWGLQDATGVIVCFYVAFPTLAVANPSLIGIGYANIQSGDSVVVECPTKWVPDSTNGGHQCLIVEAFIPLFDDLTSPLDPFDDRHVGQKNQQLVQLPPGEFFVTTVQAANAMSIAQALTFEVQPLPAQRTAQRLPSERGANAMRVKPVPPTGPLPLSFRLDNSSSVFTGPSAVFARRLLNQTLRDVAGTSKYCSEPAQITQTTHFEPWEARKIEITGQVPPDAQPGQTYSFRIVQRMGRMINGGYTVHVEVVAKRPRRG